MREPRVLSVNIGRPVLQRVPKGRPTGIAKGPVDVISVADPGPKRVGDVWYVGTAVLEVRGPRVPCATFAERLGERGWVKRFASHGRSGVYLQVNQPGQIRPGDSITVTPSGSGLDVPTLLRAFLGDPDAARAALDSRALAEHRAAELAATARRV